MYILIVLLLPAAAYLTYMRSLKDSQKRRRVQGKLEHKIVCRRQGRLREVRNLSCFFFLGGGGQGIVKEHNTGIIILGFFQRDLDFMLNCLDCTRTLFSC